MKNGISPFMYFLKPMVSRVQTASKHSLFDIKDGGNMLSAKYLYSYTRLHSLTHQKFVLLTDTAAKTSDSIRFIGS
jgi:hypothetical protein